MVSFDLWALRVGAKVTWGPKQTFGRGIVGTAVIEGWVEWERGEIVRQTRPGNSRPFRKPRGVCGPFSWILRHASLSGAPPGPDLVPLRAGYWDLPEVQEHLLCYAERYGVSGLAPDLLAKLEQLRAERKDKTNEDGSPQRGGLV
jgi:hypothetical protein